MKNKNHPIYAAIDIGSNAVRLLIKRLDGFDERELPVLKKLILVRVPIRLGEDVFESGKIKAGKAENLVRLMKAYKNIMKIFDVYRYRACATSAMRDASNGASLIKKIKEKTDINIEIIDGEQEARIVLNNRLECVSGNGKFLFVDVGGGSTELNLLCDGELKYSSSFNIGTVRSIAGKVTDSERMRLRTALDGIHAEYLDVNIIGSGGNINKLYKLSTHRNEKDKSMPVSDLKELYNKLYDLSLEERMRTFDLKPDRADVIVPAAKIFIEVATRLEATNIRVPVIGVADGIIDGMILRN